MRLPNVAHTAQPWRIHELAPDFRLLDVWALPTPGDVEDFPRLVELITGSDWSRKGSPLVRGLWAIRTAAGSLLGWDGEETGLNARVASLAERLPDDLRPAPGRALPTATFSELYRTGDEWAAEIANRTVHGVLHVGWVEGAHGSFHGQMAVLVKPNGLLGEAYMAAIGPFRHLFVYPEMMRQIERAWRTSRARRAAAG